MKSHTKQTKFVEQATINDHPQPIELTDAELEAVTGGLYGGSVINGEVKLPQLAVTDPHVQDAQMIGGGLGMGAMNPF